MNLCCPDFIVFVAIWFCKDQVHFYFSILTVSKIGMMANHSPFKAYLCPNNSTTSTKMLWKLAIPVVVTKNLQYATMKWWKEIRDRYVIMPRHMIYSSELKQCEILIITLYRFNGKIMFVSDPNGSVLLYFDTEFM